MIQTLEDFFVRPFDVAENCDILSNRTIAEFKKLLSFKSKFYPYKKFHCKKLIKLLITEKKLDYFSTYTLKTFKKTAYMNDNGSLYLSWGCFLKMSSVAFVVTLCHEFAHLWLKGHDFYHKLKVIDKQFRTNYSFIKDYKLFAPIEFYADYFCIKLLKEIINSITNEKVKNHAILYLERKIQKQSGYVNTLSSLS